MILAKARRPAEGTTNPFKLPRGEKLRREVVAVFREQRTAIVRWLKTGEKDAPGLLDPGHRLRPWDRTGAAAAGLPRILALAGRKDQQPPVPLHWPDWDDFGLGALKVSERMTPILALTWEAAADAFAPRVGLDPNSWSVVNPYTERMIEEAALAFCQSTNDTTSQQLDAALADLRSQLNQGIVQHGEALDLITKRVGAIFDGAETWRARRIAFTETSRAVHAAQEQAAIHSGVVTGWKWLLSSDACPTCVAIAARCPAVRLGKPFAVIGDDPHYSTVKFPPAHPHCCLPETPVVAPIRIAGIKAHYDGPVVRLRLSDGSDVTVTPNHMLLTPQGFALAGSLVEGDYVLRYGVAEGVAGADPYDGHVPTPIRQVFDSLAESGGVTAGSVPVAPEYLHGDAALCEGDIDVVTPNRLLWHAVCAESFEPFLDGSLRWPHLDRAYFSRPGDLAKTLFALRDATDGGMGSLRESKARLWAQAAIPEQLGGGQAPDLHSGLQEPFPHGAPAHAERKGDRLLRLTGVVAPHEFGGIDLDTCLATGLLDPAHGYAGSLEPGFDGVATDTERLRDCVGRLAGKVSTCHVISVEHLHYVGPVYDLTTGTSLYLIGNGIVSSNCACSLVEVLDTDPQPAWGDTLHDPDPATDAEHEAVMAGVAGRDAAILAGSKRMRPAPAMRPVPLSRKAARP